MNIVQVGFQVMIIGRNTVTQSDVGW